MNAAELHTHLTSLGVDLAAENGRLRVSAARGRITAELQRAINEHRTELLELLSRQAANDERGLVAVPRRGDFPLSFFQERLWVSHRLDPGSTAYNLAILRSYDKSKGASRLVEAIRDVANRHEILRSIFRERNGVPRVQLLSPEAVPIKVLILDRDGDGQQHGKMLDEAIEVATHMPFDLATEPPVRFTVYQHVSGFAVLLVSAHHIAVDAWSLMLLRHEIDSACQRLSSEEKPAAAPPLQYIDFAVWQRAQDPMRVEPQVAWWQQRLAGIPQLCLFPPDRTAPVVGDAGAVHTFRWTAEFYGAIRSLAQSQGATVYMALLAACSAVLQVHTGLDDIVLGSPMGIRERREFETMIGPFVNLLVIRLNLADDPTFAELLRTARDAVLDAYEHRDVPFELLVERLKPARTLLHQPVFQVAVVQHNATDQSGERINTGGAIHDFTWFVREVEGLLESAIEYRSDLYSSRPVERIASHLETVLRAAVANIDIKLSNISLLTPPEWERVVVGFNTTATDLDYGTFVEQFERQVAATPEACAISFERDQVSYATLNRRANQLARYLRSLGIGTGALVGLCLDRSPDLVVALLGIQKAGAAYVPLDPAFPMERLLFMLADSGATMLVASGDTAAELNVPEGVRVLDLAAANAMLDRLDGTIAAAAAGPQDLAYVIYTSGSLGQPKGVAIPHRALSNFLGSMRREPGLAATDILAAVTTVSFDIAGLELYLPLLVGARIELIPRETAVDGAALAKHLAATAATMMQATPVTWRQLVDAGWRGRPGFRALCGGETLPEDLAETLLERVQELWNLYGPTESTIWSTIERVERRSGLVSIGRPIANTTIYIVSRNGEPLPIGMPGEIWIGGAGVAMGYHRRPELTAECFVPDPFTSEPGARLYRTGDLGRWGDDGRLYHIGRMDRQVKIHGVRIELGEIEAALGIHPAVRQAIVLANQHGVGSGVSRLVAYVVYQIGEDLTATEVRRFLRRRLPDIMVPSVIVALDAIPLTPNGKINRKALPDPFKNAARTNGFEKPEPGAETQIAKVWQDILGVAKIGAQDNFFELGGHSVLALRVAAAVEKDTGCRMDPRALFFQSLRQIAASLRHIETFNQSEKA